MMEYTGQNLQIDGPSSGQSIQSARGREKLTKNTV